jgi:hypothetical protein
MFTPGNVTGMKMMMFIGIAKAFIMAGKLQVKGNINLEQLLDENAQAGGDLNALLKSLGLAAGTADQCGLDLNLADKDLADIFGEDEVPPIAELPACSIEMILGFKTTAKKNSGELSVMLNISLPDTQDVPAITLAFTLSGQHLPKILPLIKSQFMDQNRISELVEYLAFKAFMNASNIKKPGATSGLELLTYHKVMQAMQEQFSQKNKEEIWLYAEKALAGFNSFNVKKVTNFSVTMGIHISDTITLSLDFSKKTKKR